MSKLLYVVGSLNPEGQQLLSECMSTLKIEYKLSNMSGSVLLNAAFVKEEIDKLQPTAILCLGTNSVKVFKPEYEDTISNARQYNFEYGTIPAFCTYNPQYLVKKGGIRSKEYLYFQYDIKHNWAGINDIEVASTVKPTIYGLSDCLTFMKEYLTEPSAHLSLDYEASSLNPLEKDFFLGGIGLATSEKASYLTICDFEEPEVRLTDELRSKLARLIQVLLQKKKLLVFNANYEAIASASQFNLDFTDFTYGDTEETNTGWLDVMQVCRCLSINGGLKEISETRLGVRGWTKDIDVWLANLEFVLKQFKPTVKYQNKMYLLLEKEGIKAAWEAILGKDVKKSEEIKEQFALYLENATSIYGSEERAFELLENWLKYKNKYNDWEIRYTDIPRSILGTYCALDARNTNLLYDKYNPEIQSRNLESAVRYYNQQMQLSIYAQLEGLVWDDEFASSLETQYQESSVESLRKFLLTAPVQKLLELNSIAIMEIQAATSLDILKKYFNPNSTQPENTKLLSKLLCTPDLKIAMLFSSLSELTLSNKMEPEECPLLYKVLQGFHRAETPQQRSVYFKTAQEAIIKAKGLRKLNDAEVAMIVKFATYTLPSSDAETIEMLSNAAAKYLGIDFDDESTWTDAYKVVFYYKLYKKQDKIRSVLVGRNGRSLVEVVDKEPHIYPKRLDAYRELNQSNVNVEMIRQLLATEYEASA